MEQITILTATICVLLFGTIGIIDGFYFHLWKYTLHKHPETRVEHWTHTVRAAAFLAMLYFLFLNDFGGKYLLLGAGVVLLDLVVMAVDLVAEGDSRKNLGGLPHKEYMVHMIANTLHFISIALILVAKPASAWGWDAPVTIAREFPSLTEEVAFNLMPGVALMVLLHLLLMNKKAAALFDALRLRLKVKSGPNQM